MARRKRLASFSGIASKVYLWALAILLLAFVVLSVFSWITAGDQARMRVEDEIDTALNGFQDDFDQEANDLQTLGKWLASQPAFVQMVQAHDSVGLTKYLEPWTDASIVDALTVTDGSGTVITRVRVDQPVSQGDSILNYPGMPEALNGAASSGIEQDKFGRLQGRLILPVYSSSGSTPDGVLVLAFFLDGDFIKHASNEGLTSIAIVYHDRILASTLQDRQGNEIKNMPVPTGVTDAERQGLPTGAVMMATDVGQYLYKFRPLQSPAHSTVGMVGVGAPLAAIDSLQNALFRAFAAGLLLAALAVAGLSALFAHALTSPIRALDASAKAMAEGDLTRPIELKNKDELGDLAQQLDIMRQQLSRALQASALEKSHAEAVIQCMGLAVVVTDPAYNIVLANPAAQALLRRSLTELVGHPWLELFVPEGPEHLAARPQDAQVMPGGPIVHEQRRLQSRPGSVFDVISAPVQVKSEIMGYVHIAQDISAQERLLRSKDEFTMNIAHELRAPTTALRTLIDVLLQDYSSASRQEAKLLIQALERAVIRFQSLVENLIDIGNIQGGRFHVRPLPTELDPIIKQATSQVSNQLKANDQTIDLQLPPGLVVLADPTRIVQVLVNFISNASKYGPESQPIRLEVCPEGNAVRISVSDRGKGIPLQDQPRLFERFYRAKDEGVGLGLGLALSKAIVEAHGGQIGLASAEGQGSAFWFTLLLADTSEEPL